MSTNMHLHFNQSTLWLVWHVPYHSKYVGQDDLSFSCTFNSPYTDVKTSNDLTLLIRLKPC